MWGQSVAEQDHPFIHPIKASISVMIVGARVHTDTHPVTTTTTTTTQHNTTTPGRAGRGPTHLILTMTAALERMTCHCGPM